MEYQYWLATKGFEEHIEGTYLYLKSNFNSIFLVRALRS